MRENSKVEGKVTLTLIGKDGKVKDKRTISNLVVNAGLNWIAEFCFKAGTTLTQMSYVALGTGVVAPDPTDTQLQTELFRKAFGTFVPGAAGVMSVNTTFVAGEGTGAITEVGVLNAASAGILWNRVVFPPFNKAAGDQLKVAVTMGFGSAP